MYEHVHGHASSLQRSISTAVSSWKLSQTALFSTLLLSTIAYVGINYFLLKTKQALNIQIE